jgi:hypothetical protein
MSIKMDCQKCGGKISVDDGFAGGVCRCPFCKETIVVAGNSAPGGQDGDRPEAPPMARPEPQEDTVPEAQAVVPPAPGDSRPMSRRRARHAGRAKRVQIALMAILLIFAVGLGGVVYIVITSQGADASEADGQGVDPDNDRPAGPLMLERMTMTPPVVFVIDAGGSMEAGENKFDLAVQSVLDALDELPAEARANVLICRENRVVRVRPEMAGAREVRQSLEETHRRIYPDGATNSQLTQALTAVLEAQPLQVFLMINKSFSPEEVARKYQESNSRLVVVSMMGRREGGRDVEELEAFAKKAGGAFMVFDR